MLGHNDKLAELNGFVASAAEALSNSWNGTVHLDNAEYLRDQGRNRIIRCSVVDAPPNSAQTVIIKAIVGHENNIYDPTTIKLGATAWRFSCEAAGSILLNGTNADPPLAARLHAFDVASGLIVSEDLGTGDCLDDRMAGSDLPALESGLHAYARSLGRLHAATIGRKRVFDEIGATLGAVGICREPEGARSLRQNVPMFLAQCETVGVAVARGFVEEAGLVAETIDAPNGFLAFSPGDACPDNHQFTGDDNVCLFDFEFCEYQHALLDAAYLRAPFPTCKCVNRIPEHVISRVESTYRTELAPGCPHAQDDALYFTALVHANAYWAVETVSWSLTESLVEDSNWGTSTARQRHPLRLANFAALAEKHGVLPAMAATARSLEAKLKELWNDQAEMPFYRPF